MVPLGLMEVELVGGVAMAGHVENSVSCFDDMEHSMLVKSWDIKVDGFFLVFKTAEPKSQIFAVWP